MKNKSLLLLLVVALSYLAQPVLRQIESDYWYFAAGSLKNFILVMVCYGSIVRLRKLEIRSNLLLIFLAINCMIYPLNILLLGTETAEFGVKASPYYTAVNYIRWGGAINLSKLYSMVEYMMVIQGFWGVGSYIVSSIMAWGRGLRNRADSCGSGNAIPL